ncbi:MAG: lysophospholipid acyltransferase family protein [Pseudomonadales bacterium]
MKAPGRSERGIGIYLEACAMGLLWLIARLLPVTWASRFGAGVFGTFGPRSWKQRKVLENLSRVLGTDDVSALQAPSVDAWRNFGSVLAEYPHLGAIKRDRVELVLDPAVQRMADNRQPFMVLAAHLGNWEVIVDCMNRLGLPVLVVNAQQKNPLLDRAIRYFRSDAGARYIAKGDALRVLLKPDNRGANMGVLLDQRADTGVMLDLFGEPAMTTIIPARIALRLQRPMVPVQTQRLPNARFRVTFHAPLELAEIDPDADEKTAAIAATAQFQRLLETWIRKDPGQWLCTKRRWVG